MTGTGNIFVAFDFAVIIDKLFELWLRNSMRNYITDIIIIIYLFIYCNWVVTRWQWLFYM